MIAEAFATSCGMRMRVELDHHTDCEEREEVIALYAGQEQFCRFMLWRTATEVVLQPVLGRPRRFETVCDALDWLVPDPGCSKSDIVLGTPAKRIGA